MFKENIKEFRLFHLALLKVLNYNSLDFSSSNLWKLFCLHFKKNTNGFHALWNVMMVKDLNDHNMDWYINPTSNRANNTNDEKWHLILIDLIDFWCLTPLSAIFQLYHGDHFQWWKKPEYPERTTFVINPLFTKQITSFWKRAIFPLMVLY